MTRSHYLALGWLCLSLAPCAFSQQAGQDPRMLAAFQEAIRRV